MRIAMFMPSLGPDALGWKVHLDFAEAIEACGHEFSLLTTPAAGTPRREAEGDSQPDHAGNSATEANQATTRAGEPSRTAGSTAVRVLPEPRSGRFWGELSRPLLRTRQLLPAAGALRDYLTQHGDEIDLLHLEVAYPHAAAAAVAVARSGWKGPMAITPMGEDILVVRDRSYGMQRHLAPAWLLRWTLQRAAALRCISPLAEKVIAGLSPDNPRRVIPLNVSTEVAAAASMEPAKRAEFRAAARARCDEEFGTAGRPIVLAFGRLHPFKGIDYLVDAATGIGDATILIVGPSMQVRPFGDIGEALQRQAERLDVAHKVNVAGGVAPERALEILAAADVVVVPSPLESLNKVCMEAAAVGTPFVVTETTGISASVPERGVGITVPPRNPATLSWAIEEIINSHFEFDEAAAADFARQFAPLPIAEQVLEFYEEALAARTT